MNVATLLQALQGRGIRIWADGERLRCNAPAGELTPDLREELQLHKQDILAFLRSAQALGEPQRAIVPLQPRGTLPPVFALGGHNGDIFCYRAFVRHLGVERPFYGLQPPGLDGHAEPLATIEALAAYFVAQVRAFHPDGSCVLAGYCAGGGIAFELAQQLQRAGTPVEYVALFGAPHPSRYARLRMLQERVELECLRWSRHARTLAALSPPQWRAYLEGKAQGRRQRLAAESESRGTDDDALALRAKVERATVAAMRRYSPARYDGRVGLFVPCREWIRDYDVPLRWRMHASDCNAYFGPDGCDRSSMLREPYAAHFCELFQRALSKS